MGKFVGWLLVFGFVIFGIMGLRASSAYRPDVLPQLYFGAAFSCLAFGAICYEVGRCADFLEKLTKSSTANEPESAPEEDSHEPTSESVLELSSGTVSCKNCGKRVTSDTERCPNCLWVSKK